MAWDPKNQYVATMSSDRSCRIYSLKTKKVIQKLHQATLSLSASGEDRPYKLFHDDTLKTFCRRLTFTPDGLILLTPCGNLELHESTTNDSTEPNETKKEKKINATFAFTRNQFSRPAAYYPSADRYSIAVRCCPLLFQLRPGLASTYNIPYRMVFAVATQNSVLLYDTQQSAPFARIARIHYTRLTDMAWSADGRILVVSSTDGYCSIVSFGEHELGVRYEPAKTEATMQPEMNAHLPPSFQNLLKGEILQDNVQPAECQDDFRLEYEDTTIHMAADDAAEPAVKTIAASRDPAANLLLSPSVTRSPRRVQLITLSSPKQTKKEKD